MEPYLPSEINLLVLRHLAREGCSDTIRCYISESSSIKEFISSNGSVDNIEAIRQKLMSPSVNGGLVHVLSDYGRAKLLLNDLITELFDRKVLTSNYLSPYDSLCTQIAHIAKLLELKCQQNVTQDKNVGTSDYPENASSSEQIVVHDVDTDVMEFPGETEEESLQLPVPISTFMEGPVLNKIVSIANKELQRGTQQATGTIEKPASSSTISDSEIDKVLMDILCGLTGEALPKTILDTNQNSTRDSTETPTAESNLMTLFQGVQTIIENTPIQCTLSSVRPEDSVTKQAAGGSLVDFLETPNKCNFASTIYTPVSKSSSYVRPSGDDAKSSEPSQVPGNSPCAQDSSHKITSQSEDPSTTTAVPVKSPKKVVTKHYSIIPIPSASSTSWKNQWKNLHRRAITPKIVVNNRLLALKNETPNKRKAKSSPVKLTPEKALDTELNFVCVPQNARHAKEILHRVNRSISSADDPRPLGDVEESETNIPLIDIETEVSQEPSYSCQNTLSTINYNDLISSAKKQESVSIIEKPTKILSFTVTANPLQLQQVQQQQNEPTTAKEVEATTTTTVQVQEASTTPNAMPNNVSGDGGGESQIDGNEKMCTRLLSSARCTRQNPLSILENKSYSTPRKKRHIRSLLFKTPPGARSERTENNSSKFLTSPSTKRKSSDLLPDFKSRKRLKWDRSNKEDKQSEKIQLAPIPEAVVTTELSSTITPTLTPTTAITTTSTTVVVQPPISSPINNLRQSPKGKRRSSRSNQNISSKSPLRRILPKPVPADYPTTAFTPILHDQPNEYVLSIPSNSPPNSRRAQPVKSVAATSMRIDSSGSGNSSLELSTSLPPTPRFVMNTLGGDSNSQSVDPSDRRDPFHYPYHFLTSTPYKLGPPRTPGKDISAVTAPPNAETVTIYRTSSIFDTPLKPPENHLNLTSNSLINGGLSSTNISNTNSTVNSTDSSLNSTKNTLNSTNSSLSRTDNGKNNSATNPLTKNNSKTRTNTKDSLVNHDKNKTNKTDSLVNNKKYNNKTNTKDSLTKNNKNYNKTNTKDSLTKNNKNNNKTNTKDSLTKNNNKTNSKDSLTKNNKNENKTNTQDSVAKSSKNQNKANTKDSLTTKNKSQNKPNSKDSSNNNSTNKNKTNVKESLTRSPKRRNPLVTFVELAKARVLSSPSSNVVSKKNVKNTRTQLATLSGSLTTTNKTASSSITKTQNARIESDVVGREQPLTVSEMESIAGLLQMGNSQPTTNPPTTTMSRLGGDKDFSMLTVLGLDNVDGFLSSLHSGVFGQNATI